MNCLFAFVSEEREDVEFFSRSKESRIQQSENRMLSLNIPCTTKNKNLDISDG